MQKQNLFILLSVACAAAFFISSADARCNVCNEFNIACINETSFQMCFNNQADPTQTFSCIGNQICTDSQEICRDRADTTPPACEENLTCGVCSGTSLFTCISRDAFIQCNGTTPMEGFVGHCLEGFTCVSEREICVENCGLPENIQCSS